MNAGKVGSRVVLELARRGYPDPFTVELTRNDLKASSQSRSEAAGPKSPKPLYTDPHTPLNPIGPKPFLLSAAQKQRASPTLNPHTHPYTLACCCACRSPCHIFLYVLEAARREPHKLCFLLLCTVTRDR